MSKKFICPVCGYVYEGDEMPEKCPICGQPMKEMTEDNKTWAAEHIVGVAKDAPEDIKQELRHNFEGECKEVGMYLAMARVAHREGYPEIGLYWEKAAFEEAEHAAKFAELLGEVLTDSTKENLKMRVDAEYGATAGKTDLAKRAKALNLDAIHDTVHEMARDEARHGKALEGLLNRYFGKLGGVLGLLEGGFLPVEAYLGIALAVGHTGHGQIHAHLLAFALEVGAQVGLDILGCILGHADDVLGSPCLDVLFHFLHGFAADGALLGHFVALVDITAHGADKLLAHGISSCFRVNITLLNRNAKIHTFCDMVKYFFVYGLLFAIFAT